MDEILRKKDTVCEVTSEGKNVMNIYLRDQLGEKLRAYLRELSHSWAEKQMTTNHHDLLRGINLIEKLN